MAAVRRLVLDVLKPHDPPLVEFAEQVSETDCVDGVTASLIELDKKVQNVELTLTGDSLDVDAIKQVIVDLGATVHSVDLVSCGEVAIEDRDTPQVE